MGVTGVRKLTFQEAVVGACFNDRWTDTHFESIRFLVAAYCDFQHTGLLFPARVPVQNRCVMTKEVPSTLPSALSSTIYKPILEN